MTAHRLYLFAVGIRNLGFSTAFTLMAVYLVRDIGVNPVELVLPASAYELAIFLFEIPTGVVADVYSRRLSVIIGYFLLGIGLLITGSLPQYAVIVIGMTITGFGSTFVSGALSAWIVDEIGQEAAAQAFVQGTQIRLIIGLLGIILSIGFGSISLNLPLLVGGIIIIFGSIILLLFMPETGFQRVPASERESWKDLFKTFQQGITFVRVQRMLLWIFIVTIIFAGFEEAFTKLQPAHILDVFVLPPLGELADITWFGIMNAMFIPAGLIATEWVRRRVNLNDNDAVVRVLTGTFIGMIASVLLFALSETFALMLVGLILTRMTMTMVKPLMEAWINQHIDSRVRATVLSIQGQVHSMGEIIGGPVLGIVGTLFTIRTALTLSTLILLPLIPVFNRSSLAKNNVN